MKKLLLVGLMFMATAITSYAQTSGKVVDSVSNEALPGATIVTEDGVGTVTGLDGTFELDVETGVTLLVSYIGYETQEVVSAADMRVLLVSSDIALGEVSVIASVAVDRKTPVAYSTITPKELEENYGAKELPEVLNMTPAVYATKQGGGIGDSRINIRGFDQRNVAVMINGIPVNDMENGWVYWSNWAGLGDAVSRIQVQRGLGASKLAINSVGGTINLITKSTESNASTFAQFDATSYGRFKALVGVNTGRTKNNTAYSLVLSSTQGEGYVEGTFVNAYSYFFSASKEFGKNHRLVFTGVGAPQEHGQRDRMLTRSDVDKYGVKYNMDLGYRGGKELNQRINYYHKPQFALNHYWNLNPTTIVSTSAYFSFGHGGGSGPLGNYAPTDDNGHIDWDGLVFDNSASNNGSVGILRNSVNNHRWLGVLSTVNKSLGENIDLTLGIDARDYKGEHFREVRDLLGGTHWTETFKYAVECPRNSCGRETAMTVDDNATSYWNVVSVTPAENRIAYDNDGLVRYYGAFGQVEYSTGPVSTFVAGSVSKTDNTRVDRYNYVNEDNQTSETVSINGFNVKAGANYNLSETSNVFFNVGKYSRAPLFGFLFQNYANDLSDNVVNEKVDAIELGYGYTVRNLAAKVNVYRTNWTDKTLLSGRIPTADGGSTRALIAGVGALHQGVELEFNSKVTPALDLGGIASIGDWTWQGDVAYELRSDIDQSITSGFAYTDGLPVGNAPQTQVGVKGRYQVMKRFDVGATYVYNDRLYADYDPSSYTSEEDKVDPYQLDAYGMLDLRVGAKVGPGYAQVQVYNVLDFDGFIEGVNNSDGTDIRYGFPSWGRHGNVSYRINF
jgi:iron complex outermembrane recepter protein